MGVQICDTVWNTYLLIRISQKGYYLAIQCPMGVQFHHLGGGGWRDLSLFHLQEHNVFSNQFANTII